MKKVKTGTIVRTVALIVVLINQILAIFGKGLPFAEDAVYQVVSVILTAGVSLVTAWKNNDYTSFAILSGKVLSALKDGKLTKEEVEDLLAEEKEAS